MRVWVPDRPGALGQVASRVGALKADVVGIEILERGGGRAVDELIVELDDASLQPLLVAEVAQVDGVDIEEIRPAGPSDIDPDLVALERVPELVRAGPTGVLEALASVVQECFDPDWAAVVDPARPEARFRVGDAPADDWLMALVVGAEVAGSGGAPLAAADDIALAPLPCSDSVLAIGRAQPPIRDRELRRITALAAVAGAVLG